MAVPSESPMACSIGTSSKYFRTNERFTTTTPRGVEHRRPSVSGRPARTRMPSAPKYSGVTTRRIVSTSISRYRRNDEGNLNDRNPPDDTSGTPVLMAACVTPGRACTRSRMRAAPAADRSGGPNRSAGNGIAAVSRFVGVVAAIGVDVREKAARQQDGADHQHARDRHLAGRRSVARTDRHVRPAGAGRGQRCRPTARGRSRGGARAAAARCRRRCS